MAGRPIHRLISGITDVTRMQGTLSMVNSLPRVLTHLCTCAVITLSTFAPAQGNSPLVGNWAGSFSSRNFASFPASIAITQNAQGRLTGRASMGHRCVKDSNLIVTIVDSSVVLGGSDAKGDTITFRGDIDSTGKLLNLSFILNGSPSARCETDDGKGSVTKQ